MTEKIREAIASGNLYAIEIAIELGIDVNVQDLDDGQTMLHRAAVENCPKIAKSLIDAGAKLDIQDFEGRTPLKRATGHLNYEIVEMLLKAGANPLLKCVGGESSLEFGLTQSGMRDIFLRHLSVLPSYQP